MTKEEFEDWKSDFRTKEIFAAFKDQQAKLEYLLARKRDNDPHADAIQRGYVLAVDDIVNIQFEETAEETA